MKKAFKTEYIILGVAIVALGLYLGLRSSDRAHYDLPEIEAIAAGKITKVELKRKNMALILHL